MDCGHDFSYEGETGRLHAVLMPDGMNLNAAGMEQLASCLDPVVHVSVLTLPSLTVVSIVDNVSPEVSFGCCPAL